MSPPPAPTGGPPPRRRRAQATPWLMLAPALLVVVVFLVGGIGQAVLQSLGYQPFLPHWHWGTSAYRQAAGDPAVRASVLLTLRITVVATLAATVLGVAAALAVRRVRHGARIANTLLQTNLAIPHLVGALCMTLLLGQTGLLSRLAFAAGLVSSPGAFPALTGDRFGVGIIAELVWKESPFIAVIALSTLGSGIDQLGDAAATLGAGRWARLRHVTLPMLAPSVAAASVLVLAFSATSYEVPYLLGRPYPAPLSVVAYQDFTATDLTVRPESMVIALGLTALTAALTLIYLTVTSRLSRRRL